MVVWARNSVRSGHGDVMQLNDRQCALSESAKQGSRGTAEAIHYAESKNVLFSFRNRSSSKAWLSNIKNEIIINHF